MSDFEVVCNAVIADLTAAGRPLEGATTHLLAPWNPEELMPDDKRHLAVWPVAEQAESPAPQEEFVTGGHTLTQGYYVLVWEMASDEEARLKLDETKAAEWFDLHNAIRARFYVEANQQLGASNPLWYAGTTLPEQVSNVRWMRLALTRRTPIAFA